MGAFRSEAATPGYGREASVWCEKSALIGQLISAIKIDCSRALGNLESLSLTSLCSTLMLISVM
jgi:hypothetical protein